MTEITKSAFLDGVLVECDGFVGNVEPTRGEEQLGQEEGVGLVMVGEKTTTGQFLNL
jgi:hypothetical protein